MVNIYIITKNQDIFKKLQKGLSNTAYMEISSFHTDKIDDLIVRIDDSQDVDIALISEDICSGEV